MYSRSRYSWIAAFSVLALCGCPWSDLVEARPEVDTALDVAPRLSSHRDQDAGPRDDVRVRDDESDAGSDDSSNLGSAHPRHHDSSDDARDEEDPNASDAAVANGASVANDERAAASETVAIVSPPVPTPDGSVGVAPRPREDAVIPEPSLSAGSPLSESDALPPTDAPVEASTPVSVPVAPDAAITTPTVASRCGDGQLQGSEQCDDANLAGEDGCSERCTREVGYVCTGQPSRCEPVLPGASCELADPLTSAAFRLEGVGDARWFRVEVPTGPVFTLRAFADEGAVGETVIYSATESCDASTLSRLATLPFGGANRLRAERGVGLDGLGGQSLFIEVRPVAGLPSSATLRLQHDFRATGCGDLVVKPGHWYSRYNNHWFYEAGEECDDGNALPADGCSQSCKTESGWDCTTGVCVRPNCGDGVVHSSEACDDGNDAAGDGCTASCQIEAGFACDRLSGACSAAVPGDACETAAALTDGTYDMIGFAPDPTHARAVVSSTIHSSDPTLYDGADRWFETTVPASSTLVVAVGSPATSARLQTLDITSGCTSPVLLRSTTFHPGTQSSVSARNSSGGPMRVAVLVAFESGAQATSSFSLHSWIRPTGCGDHYVDAEETCDDGNTDDGDGCSATCQITRLPGDTSSTALPLADGDYDALGYLTVDGQCRTPYERNGARWFTARVPAGQRLTVDVTSATGVEVHPWLIEAGQCQRAALPYLEPGASHRLSWYNFGSADADLLLGVQGNTPFGSWSAPFDIVHRLSLPSCGDGVLDAYDSHGTGAFEGCDDGNLAVGDGCSASCVVEAGYVCSGSPSACTPY